MYICALGCIDVLALSATDGEGSWTELIVGFGLFFSWSSLAIRKIKNNVHLTLSQHLG